MLDVNLHVFIWKGFHQTSSPVRHFFLVYYIKCGSNLHHVLLRHFPLRVLDHFGSDASIYMLIDMAIWGNHERLPHTKFSNLNQLISSTSCESTPFIYLTIAQLWFFQFSFIFPTQTIKSIEKKEPGTKRSGKIFTAVVMTRYHAISVGFANLLLQQIEMLIEEARREATWDLFMPRRIIEIEYFKLEKEVHKLEFMAQFMRRYLR